jgi:xanthine dehydrogenase YagR molybdenum-binding subunit
VNAVEFRLGDSVMPPTPPHGASMTMASVGSAVQVGCDMVRRRAVDLAVNERGSPPHGVNPDDVIVRDGRLQMRNDYLRGEAYQDLLTRNNRPHLEMIGTFTPPQQDRFSMYAYGAVFAEVAVDARLGVVRVRRLLGVYDAGRIINPKLELVVVLRGGVAEVRPAGGVAEVRHEAVRSGRGDAATRIRRRRRAAYRRHPADARWCGRPRGTGRRAPRTEPAPPRRRLRP